jgi:hypothetical protein
MICPETWGWVRRVEVSGIARGPVVGSCSYVGGDTAEVRIRHFDPSAARDAATLEKERNLMNQPGDSRSPFGYFIRWDEPGADGKSIPVERYTMKRAGMLIDCETRFTGYNQGDRTLGFYELCHSMQQD